MKLLLVLILFVQAPTPKVKTVVIGKNHDGTVNTSTSVSCPKGWMVQIPTNVILFYNSGDRTPEDMTAMVLKATCVKDSAKEKGK